MTNDRIPKRETILEGFCLVIEYWVLVINWSLVIGDWLFITILTSFYLFPFALSSQLISAIISRIASSRPTKTARAMMLWPMLNSSISGITAISFTL